MAFPEQIKALRTGNNQTQKEFAESVGLSVASIIAYERGEKKPSYDVLLNISKMWNVSLDWLCGTSDGVNIRGLVTVGEFIQSVVAMCSSNIGIQITRGTTTVGIEFLRYDSECPIFYRDPETGEEGVEENVMTTFLDEYQKILSLWREGTITDSLYTLWIQDQIQKYGKNPLET